MQRRKIEDQLREEYFDLLPEIRKVVWQLEAEIRYHTLPILQHLTNYEQLVVKSRIKECESAVNALRRRQEGRTFDPDKPGDYSILNLPDLAGVRVLVFPRGKLIEVDQALRKCFKGWTSDPVRDANQTELAFKYSGYCQPASSRIRAEYQVVPMLIGLFWEVEHSAMYKPDSSLKGIGESKEMIALKTSVELALAHFEVGFEAFVQDSVDSPSGTL